MEGTFLFGHCCWFGFLSQPGLLFELCPKKYFTLSCFLLLSPLLSCSFFLPTLVYTLSVSSPFIWLTRYHSELASSATRNSNLIHFTLLQLLFPVASARPYPTIQPSDKRQSNDRSLEQAWSVLNCLVSASVSVTG